MKTPNTNESVLSASSKPNFTNKSTATEAQYERIDRMLSTGAKSTFDFRRAGIMAPAARIKEMNEKLGYNIATIALRDIYDEEGFLHKRVGVYELIERPQQAQPTAKISGAA
jgi:hypothetical protein